MRGFTLIEVLLSVAIIGILVGLSLPIYQSFQNRNDLDIAAQNVTDTLRRAETYSRAVNGDSQWGVEIQSGAVTLFKGTSFASRNTTYDEAISMSTSISLTGLSEVLFTKVTGAPNTTGSVTLTSSNNDTRTVTINAKGMVDY